MYLQNCGHCLSQLSCKALELCKAICPTIDNFIISLAIEDELLRIKTSSLMLRLPIKQQELDTLKTKLDLQDVVGDIIDWPYIDSSPINEYNTKGLLDLTFPTLFPNGIALLLQP